MTTYTYDQTYQESLKYFKGNDLSAKIFVDKYALRSRTGEILELSPDQMHRRLAKEFARIEAKKFKQPYTEEFIYSLFEGFKHIIPQGSPIFAIGNNEQIASASNCFVVESPIDSYGGICKTDQELVQISKRRGGVGLDLSKLRPKGSATNNSSRSSTGILSWMKRYSNSIREVGQCLDGDSLVITSNGLKKIKDVRPEQMVWTKEGWTRVINVLQNGQKELYKVTTNAGYSVLASKDHIFQTFNVNGELTETKLEDLEAGDGIVLCIGNGSQTGKYVRLDQGSYENTNNKPVNCVLPSYLDEKLAYLLGYSYGDGSVDINEYGERALDLACSNDYYGIKQKLKLCSLDVFKYDLNTRNGDGDLERLSLNNKTVVRFLKHNNLLKQKSEEISFPEPIIYSPVEVQKAFIAGYFDADGDNTGKKGGYRFRSINLSFLEKVQVLLSSFGILSKISFEDRSKQGWQTLYSLAVVGKSSTQKFVDFSYYSEKVMENLHISKRDCWLTPFKAKSVGVKYNSYSFCPDNSQYLSVTVAEKLGACSFLAQDNINTIKKVSYDETYDLVLEKEHLFWCNGIYLHNSGRRGALMLTISVHHPDVMDFITAKNNDTDVTGANISVRLSDEFLNAVKNETTYELRFPVDSKEPIVSKQVDAKTIWNTIIHNAWLRAEPGILFWDTMLKESIPDRYEEFQTVSTNPCGEIVLSANDSCRLFAINLFHFVRNAFTPQAYFDFRAFYESAQIAQRLMDDLVDLELEKIDIIIDKIENDPEPTSVKAVELALWIKMREACINGRRTGLGITALGDVVAAVGLKYGSDESIDFVEEVYKTLKFGSYSSSVRMAKQLGPFPVWNWKLEKDNPFLKRFNYESIKSIKSLHYKTGEWLYQEMSNNGRRNIANLTTAPTGTISNLAQMVINGKSYFGTTSGIEPTYTWQSYTRRKKGNPGDNDFRSDMVDQNGDHWMEFTVYPAGVQAYLDVTGKDKVDEDCPYYGGSAEEIVWTQRVKLQAAAQKHVDHSISSTVNLPADISEEEVAKIYTTAWESGCKGVTVYRDGCRTGVLVKKDDKDKQGKINKIDAPKRPKTLDCDIYNISVSKNKYTVVVGLLNGEPYEVFCVSDYIDKHKHGKLTKNGKGDYIIKTEDSTISLTNYLEDDTQNALLRLISTSLRHGASIHFIVEQLQKTKGDLTSFSKCVARALKKYVSDGTNSGEACECGEKLFYQEGCLTCKSCGYSKCN